MGTCRICKKKAPEISSLLSVCGRCIRENFSKVKEFLEEIHIGIKKEEGISLKKQRESRLRCELCINNCCLQEGEISFCGLRKVEKNKLVGPNRNFANLEFYFDPLPTNCVASFCCAATGCGYPQFSYTSGDELGYKNLAVFFNGCSFNCLFCQNYHYRKRLQFNNLVSVDDLLEAIDSKTSCVCFFGGEPSCQIEFTIEFSRRAIEVRKNRILRICWETNGSFNPKFNEEILNILLESGGTIKFDLKFFSPELNLALCGKSNKQSYDNFSFFARNFYRRKNPPLVCVSTPIVSGYTDEREVEEIAQFVSQFDRSIPYSLLGFWPCFYLKDLPPTSKELMYTCYHKAKKFLDNVNIGNKHLLT
ncbi:MAG: radical SAM protein [Candidatus Omnitrophota bacterium]|nr:MAG: radical SAM protein [Candidatus Omnitrophota bacterium]